MRGAVLSQLELPEYNLASLKVEGRKNKNQLEIMLKHLLIFSFILVNSLEISRDLEKFEKIWLILIQLESGGKPNAIGDNGKAIGPAQIHKAYWQDAVEYDKTIKGEYKNCFDINYSKKIVYAYLLRYSKSNNWEEWCRLHNSGPNWAKKKHLTNGYWAKFKKIGNL